MLEGSVAQWAVGIVTPGVAAGVAALLWVCAPLREQGKEGRLILAGTALLLLGAGLSLVSPSAGASWTARVAATAWLTVVAGAAPRLLRRRREPRVAGPAASPYRTGRAIDGPSLRAYSEERVSFRLVLVLTLIAGVGGLAWAPASSGWRPWHEPAAPK